MQRFTFFILIFLFATGCKNNRPAPPQQQPAPTTTILQNMKNQLAPVDVSPMDMSYFPEDYPQLKMAGQQGMPVMRVIYSRPHLQGRKLFKDIIKYNEPWRLGANEATELDVYRNVVAGGTLIKPGRYVLYCIPQEKTWDIIINANVDSWGLKPNAAKDLFKISVPVTLNNPPLEYFTLIFKKTATGADLVIGWDDALARLPFVIK